MLLFMDVFQLIFQNIQNNYFSEHLHAIAYTSIWNSLS